MPDEDRTRHPMPGKRRGKCSAPVPTCRLTIRVTGNDGRPVYTAELGGVSQRLSGQTELRDLVRRMDATCAAAGATLEVDVDGLDPAVVAAWRVPLIPPAG